MTSGAVIYSCEGKGGRFKAKGGKKVISRRGAAVLRQDSNAKGGGEGGAERGCLLRGGRIQYEKKARGSTSFLREKNEGDEGARHCNRSNGLQWGSTQAGRTRTSLRNLSAWRRVKGQERFLLLRASSHPEGGSSTSKKESLSFGRFLRKKDLPTGGEARKIGSCCKERRKVCPEDRKGRGK